MLQELADGLQDYLENKDFVMQMATRPMTPPSNVSLIQLKNARLLTAADGVTASGTVASTDVTKGIYAYKWLPAGGGPGGSVIGSDDYAFFAMNGAEITNDGANQESYGVSVSGSNPTVELLSIGATGETEPIVIAIQTAAPMTKTLNVHNASTGALTGTVKFSSSHWFSAGNDVTVSC